jgi:hypothetical protein
VYYDAVKIISNALKDGTIGVNAMIDTLDLPDGVSAPPDVVDIVDEVTNVEVADKLQPQNTPAIYVMLDDPIIIGPLDMNGVKQKIEDLPIVIRYLTRNAEPVALRRQAMLTMRAIVKTLVRLDNNANSSMRELNQIYLIAMTNLAVMEIREGIGDAMAVGAVVVTYQAENQDP